MDTKIFLQGFDSKVSSNTSEGLNVQFKGRRKLLPLNDVADVISQYDQYREERGKCNIIRLTCQVNPICSNVLFNRITEIVKNEGSSGVTFLNYAIYGTDKNGKSYESKQEELFSGVTYKPNCMSSDPLPMEFWSGGSMNYQGFDESREYDSSMTIFSSIKSSTDFYANKEIMQSTTFNHPTNSIRDTQLSNDVTNFVYHCGLDIFNNHLIRSNTFKTICKMPEKNKDYNPYKYESNYHGFNTIADVMRDVRGDKVIEKLPFPITAPVENHARLIALHLYEYDDLDIFTTALSKKLIKKYNGWLGFENRSKIKSYIDFSGSTELKIEKPIMYMSGGDFVDMYPGRDLYKFAPNYNNFRKRIEKNWNYCITYPSSSYTPTTSADPFSEIIECSNGINSMKAIYFNENTRADNGTTQLVIYSAAKHGLIQGDYVNIYKTYTTKKYWVIDKNNNRISEKYNTEKEAQDEKTRLENDSASTICSSEEPLIPSGIASTPEEVTYTDKIIDNAEVAEVVDDYIFTVFNSSVQISKEWIKLPKRVLKALEPLQVGSRTFKTDALTRKFLREVIGIEEQDTIYYIVNDEYVNVDITAQNISYKKVVGDIECDYYIRIFSKLPNFKFASGDTSSEYALYKDHEKIIHEYQDKMYDFESHPSRLAFAKNIYTDEIGEVVFTDDIDISNIHDNLGRPLTSLYMTFIKNNKGYKEWYGYDYVNGDWDESEISGDTVEFSHAFGKITCGIETSFESNYGNDVNSINRITNISKVSSINSTTPSGFMIDGYLNYTDEERTYKTESGKEIRIDGNEIWYDTDKQFYGDLCYYDGYNAIEKHISYVMHRFNTAQRESSLSMSSDGKSGRIPYFKHYVYDEIVYDDYDSSEEYQISALTNSYNCDDKEEGYYYIPHYEIPIKTFDKLESLMPDFLTIRQMLQKSEIGENVYQFTTLQQHFLSVGDKAMIYDRLQDKYYNLVAISGANDDYRVFTCLVYDEKTDEPVPIDYLASDDETHVTIVNLSSKSNTSAVDLNDFRLFKMDNLGCPSYAKVLKDGTCRVIWRNIINNGLNENDDSVEEYPFTNGAFYINKKIDIYVRRQDPHDEYWLYAEDDVEGVSADIAEENNYTKEADIEC